jgi:predicted Zn-dependent peptidase
MKSFDQLGVHFSANSGFDFTTVTLYGLPSNVVRVLPLLSEVIQYSTFPSHEIEILAGQFIQNLKINLQKNSYVAGCMSREAIFGKLHPYGRDITVKDIEQVDRESITSFHQSRYSLQSIILSGRVSTVTSDAIIKVFDTHRAGHNSGVDHEISELKNTIKRENFDSVQSSIRLAKRTIQRIDPDYPSMLLLNHALGGYFGSRLMKSIREAKGLTYGIHSSIHSLKNASYFSIGTDVRKEDREAALDEIKYEITRLSGVIMDPNEFLTVKNHFIGSLQTELSTPFAHAEKVKTIILQGLSLTFYQELLTQIHNLTPEDLKVCAQKHLDAESLTVVSIG